MSLPLVLGSARGLVVGKSKTRNVSPQSRWLCQLVMRFITLARAERAGHVDPTGLSGGGCLERPICQISGFRDRRVMVAYWLMW